VDGGDGGVALSLQGFERVGVRGLERPDLGVVGSLLAGERRPQGLDLGLLVSESLKTLSPG
jgi:hypothetical protein